MTTTNRKALSKWVLFEHIRPINRVRGGADVKLHIPDTVMPTILKGRVLSVGPDVKGIQVGDTVYMPPTAGFPMDGEMDEGIASWEDMFLVEAAEVSLAS